MSDLLKDPVTTLREALAASVARIPTFEATVATAQERLRRELRKVEKLRELVALYEAAEAPETAMQFSLCVPRAVGRPALVAHAPLPPQTDKMTKQDRLTCEVTGLLELHGSVHRAKILQHLIDRGVMGHEKNPMGHLAAFLSDSRDKFTPDGRGNFTLRRDGHHEPPPAFNI